MASKFAARHYQAGSRVSWSLTRWGQHQQSWGRDPAD